MSSITADTRISRVLEESVLLIVALRAPMSPHPPEGAMGVHSNITSGNYAHSA